MRNNILHTHIQSIPVEPFCHLSLKVHCTGTVPCTVLTLKTKLQAVSLRCTYDHIFQPSVADPDPGYGAFLTLEPGSGMAKKSRCASGMNIPDHISER
jgi:hypothetical protein